MNKKNKILLSTITIILALLIIISVILVKNIIKEKKENNKNVINSYNEINTEQNINNNYYINESNEQNIIENNNTNQKNTIENTSNQNESINNDSYHTGIAEDPQKYEKEIQESIDNYLSDKITPRGISTLYGKYKGKNDKNDLFRNFKKFVDYIEVLSNDTYQLSDNEIRKYYRDNKNTITDYLGQTEDQFYNFIKNMNGKIYKSSDFSYCEIDDSSYSDNGTYLTFNINFIYKNTNLKVKVLFANEKGFEPEVVYQ